MCMELAPGGELAQLIKTHRNTYEEKGIKCQALSIEVARFFTSEIIEALEYLHSNKIIHMDLKPESKSNILS